MLVIYFDEKPKESREDLYDREKELSELHSSLSHTIVLLTGIRRIGKTSVLKVFLNEIDVPYALTDVRSPLSSYKSLYSVFSGILTQINKRKKLESILRHLRGISFVGVNVSLSWGEDRPSLISIMDGVDSSVDKVVLAFDEAQNLRGKLAQEFVALLAHCYDYCKNTTFILTGSEVGLLQDLLRIEDPSSPLYGRHIEEIRLERFDRDSSIAFLVKGFAQAKIKLRRDVIEYAVDNLDGVIGWLTEFGNRCVGRGEVKKEIVDEVLKEAVSLVKHELSHFSKEYIVIIEAIAKGYNRWSEIKRYFEEKEKRNIFDAELRRYLEKLEKRSYITRVDRGKYEIIDPVVKNAFSRFV